MKSIKLICYCLSILLAGVSPNKWGQFVNGKSLAEMLSSYRAEMKREGSPCSKSMGVNQARAALLVLQEVELYLTSILKYV